MGIFDKINKHSDIRTTSFYFGATEAEAENIRGQSLVDYFEDYLDVLSNLRKGKFIFTGRKGVGKSAIAKYIRDTSINSVDSCAKLLKLSDLDLEKVIAECNLDDSYTTIFFEWLILLNIVKLIVDKENGVYTDEYIKLKKFLDKNAGFVDVDKLQMGEVLRKNGAEINFSVLTHTFGGIFKKYVDVKLHKAPFYKLIPPLKEVVKTILGYEVNKSSEYWLLFDDLDLKYDPKSKQDNDKLMDLIRIAKEYNNDIFTSRNAKILIFLRDDMRDILVPKYPDSAKIFSSYEIHIDWLESSSRGYSEETIPLKKLLTKRIEINFNVMALPYDDKDPWASLFEKTYYNSIGQNKSAFKTLLDFTFYRPRDFLNILKVITENDYDLPISFYTLKKILNKYISYNLDEIRSELGLIFSEEDRKKVVDIIFNNISQDPNLTLDQLCSLISQCKFDMNTESVVENLLAYSYVILRNQNGDLLFNYRKDFTNKVVDRNSAFVTLPKCIYHHFKPL